MDAPYRQTHRLRYPQGFPGFPCIVAKGTEEAVVSDWSGNLTLLDLHRKAVVRSENVSWMVDGQPLGCQTLTSLELQPDSLRWCAVATRGGYAALWNPDSSEVVKIHPERGGSVNAVAFSPDGSRLALGTGIYNLTAGRVVRAHIEVWSLSDGEPTHQMSTTLPGVCVDRIHWDTSQGQIVCTSGDESQEYGHLCGLDGDSLRADCLDRVPLAGVDRILATWDTCLVVHREGIHAYDRQDFSLKWSHTESVERADFAYDETTDLLLHSAGTVLSMDGEVVGRVEMSEGVSCLTPKPDGGFLCVSKTGVVTTWEPAESYKA